jgi:hypothetical protein
VGTGIFCGSVSGQRGAVAVFGQNLISELGGLRDKQSVNWLLSACHNKDFGLQGCYTAQRVG